MVKKVFVCFGTRPEAIKMAPVIMELKKHLNVIVCVTGQHNKMLYQVLKFFEIEPDIDLKIMKKNQDILMTDIVTYIPPFGILGRIANIIFIKNKLKAIFDYRENKMNLIFNN